MKTETAIKLVISSVLGIIIDQAFSITDIIKQAIEPMMDGPFLTLAKPLIVILFFLMEIAAIYEAVDNIKWIEKLIK